MQAEQGASPAPASLSPRRVRSGEAAEQMLPRQGRALEAHGTGARACSYPSRGTWHESSDRNVSQMVRGRKIEIEQDRARGAYRRAQRQNANIFMNEF